jgi:hypothetical protein
MDLRKHREKNTCDLCGLLHQNQLKLCSKMYKRKCRVFSGLQHWCLVTLSALHHKERFRKRTIHTFASNLMVTLTILHSAHKY